MKTQAWQRTRQALSPPGQSPSIGDGAQYLYLGQGGNTRSRGSGKRETHEACPDGSLQVKLPLVGGAVYLRTPIIPGYNDDLEELGCIARFLADLPARGQVQKIQLLPYHNYGVGKYVSIGLTSGTAQTRPPEDAFLRRALQLYLDLGLPAQIS